MVVNLGLVDATRRTVAQAAQEGPWHSLSLWRARRLALWPNTVHECYQIHESVPEGAPIHMNSYTYNVTLYVQRLDAGVPDEHVATCQCEDERSALAAYEMLKAACPGEIENDDSPFLYPADERNAPVYYGECVKADEIRGRVVHYFLSVYRIPRTPWSCHGYFPTQKHPTPSGHEVMVMRTVGTGVQTKLVRFYGKQERSFMRAERLFERTVARLMDMPVTASTHKAGQQSRWLEANILDERETPDEDIYWLITCRPVFG